jgi:NAD(P)H-dependent FMN reductase
MNKILGISGSLRKGSYNSALLRAAQERFPGFIEIGNIHDIPMYNGDVEEAGLPESVLLLKEQLINSAGLLLVSPEYNNSIPGVLKNTIDWLSRPFPDIRNVFRDRPVGLIGASPGGFGTILGQSAWLPVFRSLGARQWSGGRLMISGASRAFDENGVLVDEAISERLEKYIQGYMEFCGL